MNISRQIRFIVTPAKAGAQGSRSSFALDARFRGNGGDGA
jgi:hypothetical protein